MIAIIDYGVGNLFSLRASLDYLGIETKITNEKEEIKAADKIILPGVGAFADAIAKLKATGLVDTIIEETEKGKYLLGICLGMQLLFEKSYEYGEHEGLGLIKGDIVDIEKDLSAAGKKELKVPHIGWNSLSLIDDKTQNTTSSSCKSQNTSNSGCKSENTSNSSDKTKNCADSGDKDGGGVSCEKDPLFRYIQDGDFVYFVHSFYGTNCTDNTIAVTEYDIPITAAVKNKTVYGTQFHPEKSGKVGLKILKAFTQL